jgi:hypothetical protein
VTVNDRVREYRKRMKEQGFKELRIWVPDVNSPAFAKAAHEQSLLLAAADRADPSVQDYIDAMQAEVWDAE